MTRWKRHWSQPTARPSKTALPDPTEEPRKMDEHLKDRSRAIDDNGSTTGPLNKPEHTFLTTGEAAYFLRLSARTLERFRVEGTGPRFTKAGPGMRARVLYRRSDLEDWLQSFQYNSTSQYDQGR